MGRRPLIKADTRADPLIEDAIGKGYIGAEEPYTIGAPFPGHDMANTVRKLVHAAIRRRNLSGGVWVADETGEQCLDGWKGAPPCADKESPHYVKFKLWGKDAARVHVYRQSGGDPANLKYNPWNQGKTQKYDDAGQPV